MFQIHFQRFCTYYVYKNYMHVTFDPPLCYFLPSYQDSPKRSQSFTLHVKLLSCTCIGVLSGNVSLLSLKNRYILFFISEHESSQGARVTSTATKPDERGGGQPSQLDLIFDLIL